MEGAAVDLTAELLGDAQAAIEVIEVSEVSEAASRRARSGSGRMVR